MTPYMRPPGAGVATDRDAGVVGSTRTAHGPDGGSRCRGRRLRSTQRRHNRSSESRAFDDAAGEQCLPHLASLTCQGPRMIRAKQSPAQNRFILTLQTIRRASHTGHASPNRNPQTAIIAHVT